MGTILCTLPFIYSTTRLPTDSFGLMLPANCALVGFRLCVGGTSINASSEIYLTNALDFSIGYM
jgi:hypothetical protein